MDIIKQKIKELSKEYFSEIVKIRRHIHANPELSFKEFKTSDLIVSCLKKYGIPYQQGIAKTGVVGMIKGKNPDSKILALRADMDALSIEEKNSCEYKSQNQGVMHACGHDVHIASLLGTAKILNELKNNFQGSIKLLFQPSEESFPGGAITMINEGVLENPKVEKVIAQHVEPEIEIGKIGIKSGMYMASADEIYITVKGKGGHAALPYKLVDPIEIASKIIITLKQIVSRDAPKSIPTILAFGRIIGEGKTNVVPDEVKIEGTFRTFNETWRKEVHEIIKTTAQSIAKNYGGTCEVKIAHGYPFLVNDEKTTENARKNAIEYLGKENVIDLSLRMTAEDFSYFAQEKPSFFYRLGTGNKKKNIISNLHSSTFDIDEKSLEIGMGMMAWLVVCELG